MSLKEKDYKKRFDLDLWKSLWTYIRPYKKQLIFLAVFMIGLAGVDMIFPLMSRYAVDNFVVAKNTQGITPFALVYLGLIIIQVLNIFFFISLAGKIEMGVCYSIRKDGFKKLQELSLNYYNKNPVGWLMARLTSDTQRLGETIAWGAVDFIWGITLMAGISIIMLVLNWKLALLTLTVVPALILISLYFQKKILKAYRRVRKTNSKITAAINEGISGAKTTKTLVREEENLNEFKSLTKKMYHSSVHAAIFSALFLPIVLSLGSIGTAIALWYGGKGVILQTISYGTLVAFLSYTVQFFQPIRELARVFAELQHAQASAERIISMIKEKPDIKDSYKIEEKFGSLFKPIRKDWESINGKIEFRDVTFKYEDGERVLENFNLKAEPGETVAIVGETGSGKSTIVNLACRFFEPIKGEILIDGVDYRKRSLAWLHSQIGYVLQSPHLFSGTIEENIRYGKLSATKEEVIKATKMVNAHEFITNLSKSYNSEVGEGGGLLSTGQKQLISFARAIISDPGIFVLDEATSSVDTETEKLIQNAINQVLQNRTSFIIAHRLSTIRSADKIIVLEEGKIIENGSHDDLIKQKGHYYQLYTNQFLEEQERGLLNT